MKIFDIAMSASLVIWLCSGCSETNFATGGDPQQNNQSATKRKDGRTDDKNDNNGQGDENDKDDGGTDSDQNVTGDDDSDIDLAIGEGSDSGENGGDISIDESEKNKPIAVDVEFSRQADHAAWTNCLYVTVNSEPEMYLGCNKVDINTTKTLTLKSKPFCNIFKFRLTSNGPTNFTTASANNVRYENNDAENVANFKGIKFFPYGEDGVGAHINDNGDGNNHTDTSFRIVGFKNINYSIENTEKVCN